MSQKRVPAGSSKGGQFAGGGGGGGLSSRDQQSDDAFQAALAYNTSPEGMAANKLMYETHPAFAGHRAQQAARKTKVSKRGEVSVPPSKLAVGKAGKVIHHPAYPGAGRTQTFREVLTTAGQVIASKMVQLVGT